MEMTNMQADMLLTQLKYDLYISLQRTVNQFHVYLQWDLPKILEKCGRTQRIF